MQDNLEHILTRNDPRYFVWAIVFLIVSGVSLVSYILITDIYEDQQLSIELVNPVRMKSEVVVPATEEVIVNQE